MTRAEQMNLLYKIFDLPPRTAYEADHNWAWNLLSVGCPVKYILKAYERMLAKDKPEYHTFDLEGNNEV